MKRILMVLLLAVVLRGQTAKYPTALASDQDLGVAKDVAASTLSTGINNSTLTIPVVSGSKFAEKQIVLIGTEQIQVCTIAGNTLTACTGTRGFNNTTPASHLTGAAVRGVVSGWYVNALREEVQAIETALGINLGNIVVSLDPGLMTEISKPAAPAADHLKVYAKDISSATYFCAQNSGGNEICFSPAGIQSDSTSPTEIEWKWQTGTLVAGASGKTNTGMSTAGVPVWRAYGGSEKTVASNEPAFITTQAESGLSGEVSLGALADNSVVAVDVATSVATPRAAIASDLTALFSGSGDYLKSDGSRGTPGDTPYTAASTAFWTLSLHPAEALLTVSSKRVYCTTVAPSVSGTSNYVRFYSGNGLSINKAVVAGFYSLADSLLISGRLDGAIGDNIHQVSVVNAWAVGTAVSMCWATDDTAWTPLEMYEAGTTALGLLLNHGTDRRSFYCANPATGTDVTLALPAACGAKTALVFNANALVVAVP